MVNRIMGALLLLRFGLPVILASAIVVVLVLVAYDVNRVVNSRLGIIQKEVALIRDDVEATKKTVSVVSAEVEAVTAELERVSSEIEKIPTSIDIPVHRLPPLHIDIPGITDPVTVNLPSIPAKSIHVPGITGVKKSVAELSTSVSRLTGLISSIFDFTEVNEHVHVAVDNSAELGRELGSVGLKWLIVTGILTIAALLFAVIVYAYSFYQDLLTGWHLLTGGDHVSATRQDVNERVVELEASLREAMDRINMLEQRRPA